MSYPDSDSKETFSLQYLEAVASADFPAMQEIRDLVSAILEKSNLPPNNPMLWPLFTFISRALDQRIPVKWLTGPPFAETLVALRQVLDFLESKPASVLLQIKDYEGRLIPTLQTLDKIFLKSIAAVLMAMPHFPDSEEGRRHVLQAIEHIEITVDGNALLELTVVAKPEAVEKTRTAVKKWTMEKYEQGKMHFVTMNGNLFGCPVEIAHIIDTLTDLVIERLNALPIHDLSLIDHLHVILSGKNAVDVKLCPNKEVVEHFQRERMGIQ